MTKLRFHHNLLLNPPQAGLFRGSKDKFGNADHGGLAMASNKIMTGWVSGNLLEEKEDVVAADKV